MTYPIDGLEGLAPDGVVIPFEDGHTRQLPASAISLLYPQKGIDGYTREEFLVDLKREAETDIRRSLARDAHCVQIDFTEARLSLKLDPSGGLLRSFVE